MSEVREGYKMTELGEIPNEWNLTTIQELFEFKNGLNKEKEYFGKGTKIINYTDVYKNRGITGSIIKGLVEVNDSEISRFNCKKGDVFFTRTSETINEIGMSSVLLEDVENLVFSGFLLRARPKNNVLDLNFKKYAFSSSYIRNEITRKSSYTTRALTSGTLLNDVRILVPTKEEQVKIASILSTVDEQIDETEQLIVKTKELKKGLMQQLLIKGIGHTEFKQTELGEIPVSWEIVSLGKIAKCRNEKFNPLVEPSQKYIALEHINSEEGTIKGWSDSKESSSLKSKFYKSDTLFGKLRPYLRKYWFADFDGVCATEILSLYPIGTFDSKFLFYTIQQDRIIDYTVQHSFGTKMPRTSWAELKEIKIPIPSVIEEQQKIAQILSTVDEQIEIYEQEKAKYEELKKGLMQQLLTGQIRVKI